MVVASFKMKGSNNKMTSSMYSAIAGLQTHMQKMGTIGNNIANANTAGFKPGVTVFTESMYTTLNSSTAGGTTKAGINPSQVGYGSKVSGIDVSMSPGTPAPTGVNTNLYLNGSGFFLVGQKPTNEAGFQPDPNSLLLRRVGDFSIDKDGFLADRNGNCVYGFLPKGTENGTIELDANGKPVYDTHLRPIRLPVYRPNPGDGAEGNVSEGDALFPTYDENGGYTYPDGANEDKRVEIDAANLSFDANGVITIVTKSGQAVPIGVIAMGDVVNPNGLTKQGEGYYMPGGNSGNVSVGAGGGILGDNAYLNGGNGTGENDQKINGGGKTNILTGYLESSKTDVSTEFADLITTQRGFQANTKIITVTDEMLAELVNMKR